MMQVRVNVGNQLQTLKPTAMIGTTGKGGQFTPEVLEAISSYQEVSEPLKLLNS